MTRAEAVDLLKPFRNIVATMVDQYGCPTSDVVFALDVAIEALEQEPSRATGKWIPVKWHEITDEERERDGCPEDWTYYLDCMVPDDEQRILITTKGGFVELDECYYDGEIALDSGYDWFGDVLAWMPLPEPYNESEEK